MGWAIALHGGAGDISPNLELEKRAPREATLRRCLDLGVAALKANLSALDVVELVTRELENCPHFNAGKGSVLTTMGTVEMEACIMDGNSKQCGAVSGLTTVVNPISLARLVMDKTPHIYLAFDGAEAFAREQGVETRDSSYFITEQNIERLEQAKEANRVQIDYTPSEPMPTKQSSREEGESQIGTVGCVAVDRRGNLASATSTGGLVNKMVGRIGDTPIIGAGTYANALCAVSATGKGEFIIRATVAREVAALMEYKHFSLKDAADNVITNVPKGNAGLVAVNHKGDVAMAFNTTGMFRACATEDGHSQISIWEIRHVGGAMRGAGADQLSILVRNVTGSKVSNSVLRFFYAIGYKLDYELLKTGFSFEFYEIYRLLHLSKPGISAGIVPTAGAAAAALMSSTGSNAVL